MDKKKLKKLCQLIRYDILTSTTVAESGHPSSSLSAVELITTLYFSGFFKENDRLVLSKGHASPLLYSLYHAAGLIDSKKLMTLRKFKSELEGHPTPRFLYVDVATGSLGQGLSIGVGMALGIKLRITNYGLRIKNPKVWVLLGDSEMAEGQVWEAMQIAAYYKLNNLIGILDVNRLGQNGETMAGWNLDYYVKKAQAFGWETIVVKDGHDLKEIYHALNKAQQRNFLSQRGPYPESEKNLLPSLSAKPKFIIAKTIKGKGVSFLENKNGWHGKTLNKEELKLALKELGKVDLNIRGKISQSATGVEVKGFPTARKITTSEKNLLKKIDNVLSSSQTVKNYAMSTGGNELETGPVATREAYGNTLIKLGEENPNIVVLDGEVANSTFQNKFAKRFPERFFQMFIAEQNMISVALGFEKIGFIPYLSTFAAFLSRAFDQIRMAQYSNPNLKIIGSHAGVSIGQDGPSQMGLEDIALFRSILNSTVLYPGDAVSSKKLTKLMHNQPGITYLRTTRSKTPVIYDESEEFEIGGLKIHYPKISNQKSAINKSKNLIIATGITLHEALKAQKKLAEKGINTLVIDLYSIKPFDEKTIKKLAIDYKNIIVVEDHYPAGGIGEAISELITNYGLRITNFIHLCVKKIPMSGTMEELLEYEEIDSAAIVKAVKAF